MLKNIIENVMTTLRLNGAYEVYSAFDAIPAERKSNGVFTTVGIGSFESSTPIYSLSATYVPFRAEIEINVTAPENFSSADLYEYFDLRIQPAIHSFENLSCCLKKLSLRYDTNIQRLVLCVKLSAGGITRIERSST